MPRTPEMQAEYLAKRANAKWATKAAEQPKDNRQTSKNSGFNHTPGGHEKKFKNDLFEGL